MRIKWLGHSCFLFTSVNGVRVLTDPFDDTVGYQLPEVEADIVTTSHDHHDHYNLSVVKGTFKHVEKPGKTTVKGIQINGIEAFHDEAGGTKRGKNIIFIYDIDGIRVCHCGDLGHIPTEKQVGQIGEVDVLLVPVGGTYTINYKKALEVIKLLNPRIAIPMHYKADVVEYPIDSAGRFLSAAGGGYAGKQEIELEKGKLSDIARVLALNYK